MVTHLLVPLLYLLLAAPALCALAIKVLHGSMHSLACCMHASSAQQYPQVSRAARSWAGAPDSSCQRCDMYH